MWKKKSFKDQLSRTSRGQTCRGKRRTSIFHLIQRESLPHGTATQWVRALRSSAQAAEKNRKKNTQFIQFQFFFFLFYSFFSFRVNLRVVKRLSVHYLDPESRENVQFPYGRIAWRKPSDRKGRGRVHCDQRHTSRKRQEMIRLGRIIEFELCTSDFDHSGKDGRS